MMFFRFIFLAICFLLSVLQTSHARDSIRIVSYIASNKKAVEKVCPLQGAEYAVAVTAGPLGISAKFALQESSAFAIETTIEESSSRAAKLITQCETLQKEFQNTIKFCSYVGLCAGSVKAGKKIVSALTKSSIERVAFTKPVRIDTIKEPEMIQKAASMPGEWNGQFKLITEIPKTTVGTEFVSDVYCKHVLFKDPKTGQMFRVFQRNDIDPNYVGKYDKSGNPVSNLELMKKGQAPYVSSGERVNVHHVGQHAKGPFVEVADSTHKSFPHKQFGKNHPHPTNPVVRSEFNSIREAYWKARANEFK